MSGEWMDFGHDHYGRFTSWAPDRALNPQYVDLPDVDRWGLIVEHPDLRDPTRTCVSAITFDGEAQRGVGIPDHKRWTLVSLEPLHTEPSLLCGACGDHGWIRAGRWEPC